MVDIQCNITPASTLADCTITSSGPGTQMVDTSTSLSDFSNMFSQNLTVTAGYEKIAAATTTATETETKTDSGAKETGDKKDDGKDDEGAAPGRMQGAALAGVVALFGSMMML